MILYVFKGRLEETEQESLKQQIIVQRNIAIAKNMLNIGMKKEDIQKLTGLSMKEIEKL